MNRSYPYPGFSAQRMRPRQNGVPAPAETLMMQIRHSEQRYMFLRDVLMKLDHGFGRLHFEAQDMAHGLENVDQDAYTWIRESHENVFQAGGSLKNYFEYLMMCELDLQDRMKRWLKGLAPLRNPLPAPPQFRLLPGGGYPTAPEMQAPLDYRDPNVAQEALKRAQAMPLGPAGQQQGYPYQQPVQQVQMPVVTTPVQQVQVPVQTTVVQPVGDQQQAAQAAAVQQSSAPVAPVNGAH